LCIQAAIRVDPANVYGWANRGILTSPQDPTLALLYFLKARECNPASALPHLQIGKALRDVGEWPLAESALHTAIELGADVSEAYLALGDVFKAQRRLPEALAAYETSVRARRSSVGYNALGNVFQDAEDHPHAIEMYRAAVELDPQNSHAWHNMANSYTVRRPVRAPPVQP
jgi:tetratricopeptide (TPR) repeat protein